jgi:hypothetical protein
MSADLAALLVQRNARFRAWRAYGSPIEARWEKLPTPADRGPLYKLSIRCLACGDDAEERFFDSEYLLNLRGAAQPGYLDEERSAFLLGCEHLLPLVDPDPPAVQELIRIELLASDPPR